MVISPSWKWVIMSENHMKTQPTIHEITIPRSHYIQITSHYTWYPYITNNTTISSYHFTAICWLQMQKYPTRLVGGWKLPSEKLAQLANWKISMFENGTSTKITGPWLPEVSSSWAPSPPPAVLAMFLQQGRIRGRGDLVSSSERSFMGIPRDVLRMSQRDFGTKMTG